MEKVVMLSLSLWVYRNARLATLDLTNPLVWLGAFVVRDHLYYWVHRTEHRVKVLWASHLVHHSPEEFGFTTAVRVPWMEAVYKPWLGLWVPLLGFNPLAFVALDAFAATIGQLQHTTAWRRRSVLDLVFITPSAHRVHHGSNPEYLDRNFGAVLCVWDRLYGTYCAETVPVRYGLIGHNPVQDAGDTLLGGYPELVAATRRVNGLRRRLRFVLSAPGVAA
jgi:sterol desaturase/sphingolipid hydroxylase (fatty acid hydroxylase superfamily)